MELQGEFDPKGIEYEVRNHYRSLNLKSLVEKELVNAALIGYVDGPPTMNGEPHIGHIRVATVKDIFYRFNTLRKKLCFVIQITFLKGF